jgi:hypothetical protein
LSNFRKVLSGIDISPLLNQVLAHPNLWNTDDSWTRNKPNSVLYATDNIVLRYNSGQVWNRSSLFILTEVRPIIDALMQAIPGEVLGKILISRMTPGQTIAPHIDYWPAPGAPFYQRYQIPISVSPACIFRCGDEDLFMEPGNAYWFNNQVEHSVINNSSDVRISMLTDIHGL